MVIHNSYRQLLSVCHISLYVMMMLMISIIYQWLVDLKHC